MGRFHACDKTSIKCALEKRTLTSFSVFFIELNRSDAVLCNGTSGSEFHLFRDGVRKVVYSYAEERFICQWPNPF